MQKESSDILSEPKLSIWLQLFKIYQILAVIFIPTNFSYELYLFFSEEYTNKDSLLESATYLPGAFFSLYILKILPERDSKVPNTIKSCIEWEIIIVSLISLNPLSVVSSYVLYYFVSYNYFIKSKRVKEYYGENATNIYYEEIPLFYKNFRG